MTTENQAAEIQRLRELLGLIPQGEWRRKPTHRFVIEEANGSYLATITIDPAEVGDAVLEFIALARNLMPSLLDAWDDKADAVMLSDYWERQTNSARVARDAALERERALVAEVAKIQELIRLRLVNDELFLYDHPEEETIFIREWTDDAQKALTPEPSPESENHDN